MKQRIKVIFLSVGLLGFSSLVLATSYNGSTYDVFDSDASTASGSSSNGTYCGNGSAGRSRALNSGQSVFNGMSWDNPIESMYQGDLRGMSFAFYEENAMNDVPGTLADDDSDLDGTSTGNVDTPLGAPHLMFALLLVGYAVVLAIRQRRKGLVR